MKPEGVGVIDKLRMYQNESRRFVVSLTGEKGAVTMEMAKLLVPGILIVLSTE